MHILKEMSNVIAEPRTSMSPHAPRIQVMRIPVEKIGDLIGPKGKYINEIIAQTGAEISIEDDGMVSITTNNPESMEKAKEWVTNLTRVIKAGDRFDGKVVKIMDFGAFIQLIPNVDGLVHISQFQDERVENVNDIVRVGDILPVVVLEVDSMGRINLSHKATKRQS
jgi:polyribonucleotide nucleotidyltransferase